MLGKPRCQIIYIANARLPTEKAHGYQIVKMCEAFVQNDAAVRLFHPRRKQSSALLSDQSVFEYYGVRPVFDVCPLPNLDIVRLNAWVRGRPFEPLFFAHAMLWGRYAAHAVRAAGADLCFTRSLEVAFWLLRLGLPTILEVHSIPRRAGALLLRSIARHPANVLTISLTSFLRDRLVRTGFAPGRVRVLADAVDLSLFEDLPDRVECRRRLGLPVDRPIVGYVGRFHTRGEEKGIPQLVEAMAMLPTLNGAEPLLVCVGGPMDAVRSYIGLARRVGTALGRLQFVDRVSNREVPLWMRACDVVTIPWPWTDFSAYFTSPMKLFEYMAAGVPIVASDLPAIREVLHDGENAWLVRAGNPASLAEGICHLMIDAALRARLAEQARRSAASFTWERRARAILQLAGASR